MKNRIKHVTSLLIALTLSFCMLAYGAQIKKTKPQNLQKLTVMLDWFINPDHAPLFVAKQEGFFKDAGLSVDLIPPSDPADAVKMVAAGKADIAISYEPQLKAQQKHGLKLVQTGTLIAMPLNCMAVLESSNIHSIKDLKGKKIGYSSSADVDHLNLRTILKTNGLTLKDVTLINVHYGLTQALMSGQVDAITGIMRNFEPFEMAQDDKPVRLFYPEENGMPLYSELIFVTQKNQKNSPQIKAFLKALRRGTIYLINHPDASWQKFIKNHPECNNDVNKHAFYATIPAFALRPNLV